jgi:hypothetical protein
MAYTYQTFVDHAIKFTNAANTTKDTWTDWHIVPTSRPVVNPPEANIIMDMIPGATEALDTSEAVGDMVTYGTRSGSWEFYVVNKTLWATVYSTIMNFLQGQLMKVQLTDDPGYYYTGRCQVNDWQSDPDASRITIDYTLNPYKYAVQDTSEAWKWDPFSFIDGVIPTGFQSVNISDTQTTISIPAPIMPVAPTFVITTSDNSAVTVVSSGSKWAGNGTYTIPKGTTTNPNIVMRGSTGTLKFTCASGVTGTVTVKYRGGSL